MPMRPRHLLGVVRVETLSNPRPWSLDLFASELRQANARCVVALTRPSLVVGFGCVMSSGFEAHITNIGVDPSWRRRGVGRHLVTALLTCARDWGHDSATLEVRAGNAAAQALYRSLGFESEGVRPRYYPDNAEDAVIMWARTLLAGSDDQPS